MRVPPSGANGEVYGCFFTRAVLTIGSMLVLLPAVIEVAEARAADRPGKPRAEQASPRADAAPAESPPKSGLTLDQAIHYCLVNDPKLRAGFEAINQAQADALTASLKPNPGLFTDIQMLPLTRPFTEDRQGGPPQQDVQLSYPIDWFIFGKRAAALASARHEVLVSEAEFADLVRQRVLEVSLAYYDMLAARAHRELARQDMENLQRVKEATETAVHAGGRPAVELARCRLGLLKSAQDLRDAESQFVVTRAKLRALLGGLASDSSFDLAGELAEPLTAEPPSVERALELASENRPDVHALRWKIHKAEADTRVEQRKACPEIKAVLGFTRQYQSKAIGMPDANSWTAAMEMTLPIFDRNQGNRAKAASVVAKNNFELQARLLELRAEIEQALQELLNARANAQALADEQLGLAAEVRNSVTEAYEAGGRPPHEVRVLDAQRNGREVHPASFPSILEVLDALRNCRETYRLSIASRADYWRALHRLNAAVGIKVLP